MVSDTRLYGASIAVASGGYSLWSASTAMAMSASGWLMVVLGAVVLVHGTVLVTPAADRLGRASGPLMIGYAAIMLLNQAALGLGAMVTGGMGSTGGMGTDSASCSLSIGMTWDGGMVALAALMLASGAIMTRDIVGGDTTETGEDGM
ncbi:MAG: hypothetical protein ABEJ86_08540 [Halococcoides sp.]